MYLQEVFFHPYHGFQIKGDFAGYYSEASTYGNYYDGQTGDKVTHKGFVQRKLGDWFYLDDKGDKVRGLQTIDGKLYYFIAGGASQYIQYGKQVKGEIVDFVDNSNISPVYSIWNQDKVTRRYYFDENTGEAVKNRYIYDRGDWYYFGKGGKRVESQWLQIGKYWYYFQSSGIMARNGNYYINKNNASYYFDAKGHMLKNAWIHDSYYWYYYGKGGKRLNNQWLQSGSKWYYFNRWGEMVTGYYTINGQRNYFNSNGVWQGKR